MKRKRRSLNQIKEDISLNILMQKLPVEWVIHEYGPDYGIDCVVELFDFVDEEENVAETLGESFYVQLKSSSNPKYVTHRVCPRVNVEKSLIDENRDEHIDIEAIQFQLETAELLTVQAMGMAVPVLLIIIDISSERAFFVCLNDYIDKVLLPEDPDSAARKSKAIRIPIKNELGQSQFELAGPRAYGKRAKMCGAFTKFHYQKKELERARGLARVSPSITQRECLDMISTFVDASLRQDIWEGHEFWAPIGDCHKDLNNVRRSLDQALDPSEIPLFTAFCDEQVWFRLCNLSNMYEELVREWFLPTYLAELTSYPA